MRVFITGGSGVLGSNLAKSLTGHEVAYSYFNNNIKIGNFKSYKLDVANSKETIKTIKDFKPDLVIHTVAVPSVDACETDKKLADTINVNGTKNVTEACKTVGAKIINISTAFVFDGTKKIYTEEDKPHPINYYAVSKLEGERVVINSGLSFIIVRTDQLYGWTVGNQKKNLVVKTLEGLESKKPVEVCKDWYNNPTFVDNCSQAITELIKRNKQGIYHVVGSSYLNRYEWALKIAEIFSLDKNLVRAIESSILKLPAKRPNCNLSNEKVEKDTGIRMLTVEEGLKSMLKNYSRVNS